MHLIEIKNNEASFFAVQQPAWHGLGKIVQEAQTQEQVLKLANLDYKMCLGEVHVNGKLVTDHFGLQRCDTGDTFGFVKGRYNIIQNSEAFLFFDEFCEKTEAIYHTAGVLKNGEIAWILAKLPEHIEVKGDVIDMYVLCSMYHDGKHAMQLMFTPTRVVCWNTLSAATRSAKNIVNIAHRANYEDRIKDAVNVMGISNRYFAEINEVFEEMAATKVNDKMTTEYFAKLITGNKNIQAIEMSGKAQVRFNELMKYYNEHPTQQNIKGSVFGLYNSVTGYFQNQKTYTSAEKRFNNIFIDGDASKASAEAFHLAQMMI